jgi:hypothetical protein
MPHTSVLSHDGVRQQQTPTMVSMATRIPKVERAAGKNSKGVRPTVLDVHAIPKESITPALVVIPTNSPQNHYF